MVGGEAGEAELARVHLACGRIAGGARAIVQAHRFGVPQGSHTRLWEAAYHAEAVRIYAETLPASYERDIASLFHHSAQTMAAQTIPARLAEDWMIASEYMRNACTAIMNLPRPEPPEPPGRGVAVLPQIDDCTPMVVRFDRLAALATSEGAGRLERAAVAVQHHMGGPARLTLEASQRQLLKSVSSGAAIVDVAEQFGYSRSSMYRELAKLWKALGVTNRTQAIRKAAADGLLD